MKRILLFITILTLTVMWTPASAQDSNPGDGAITDNEVNQVAKELYCPVCENIPLDVCGTQACADWREEIRLLLSQGWSKDEIKDQFANRFGDRVLAAPPARGLNWLVYIVPPVAFFAGVFILFRGIKSWRQMAAESEDEIETIEQVEDDDYIARLEEELKKQ